MRQIYAFVGVLLFVAVAAFGQTTGSMTGAVTSGGAPLPGVLVTINSPSLQGTRTAVTGEGGGFTFPSIPPGNYTVTYELEGMQKVTNHVTVSLASTANADADLKVSGVSEAITVTAAAPAVLETTDVQRNFTGEQIAELPVSRNIRDTVLLAPGVNAGGARNNISISGGASYDNLFLVNGVTVNENLRGQPHDLFIEDAIQETTILTGAISAEYGRFTGGVVSTITKSGGNEFTGSLRDSLSNASWIAKTPIETADHPDKNISIYEGTLGGYAIKDRIWFFGSGRKTSGAPAVGFDPTGSGVTAATSVTPITFQNTIDETRFEGKLTAQVLPKHSIVASYLDIDKTESNNYFAPIYDVESIVESRELPNSLKALNYNGVITSNLLLEAQWSKKEFAFIHSGGRFTDQIKGTWVSDANARWNAPVFCGVCTPERRDNDSLLAKGTYFLNTRALGTHSIVVGGERYHETRLVNNFQSASQFQIASTGTAIMRGTSTEQIFPRFDTGTTVTWRPVLELSNGSDLNTNSAFINDKWDFNRHFSFNVGVRFDKNDAVDASGHTVSDDSAFSPRLGVIYDILGNGRFRANASYSHYVTKIVDGNVGGSTAGAGNPASFSFRYGGPVVNAAGTPDAALLNTPAALQVLFNWFNSLTPDQKAAALTSSSIPGFSTQIEDPISSPYVREMVLGFGGQIGSNSFARIDLINRDWHDFYATRLDQGTGRFTANNPVNNKPVTGDRAILVNDDENLERRYRGIQTQINWRPGRFNVGGGYTWSKLTGNDVPEGDGTAAVTNTFGQFYPEYLNYTNRAPVGYLTGDQRHRLRAWAGYDFLLPMGITLTPSVLQSYDSGRAFSAVGSIDPYGATTPFANSPRDREAAAGVQPYTRTQLGTTANYYFGKRGQFRTEAVTATDFALNFSLPIHGVEIFSQAQVLNVFNETGVNDIYLSRIDQTVLTRRSNGTASGLVAFNPYTDTPVECPQGNTPAQCTALGANFQLSPTFGQAISKDAYQTPRTYRFAIGLRF
ncbi:MAG TPA: TonB-dependent receptor [Thermoanaerobaculia bacterium]|jgi:outer membrane receptor protein involved in Fe transport